MRRLRDLKDEELIKIFKSTLRKSRLNLESLSLLFKTSRYTFVKNNKHKFNPEKRSLIIQAIIYMNNNPSVGKEPKIKTDSVEEFIKKVGIRKLPTALAEGVFYSHNFDSYL